MNTTLPAKDHAVRYGRLFLQRLNTETLEEAVDEFMEALMAHPGTASIADPSHGMRETLLHEARQGHDVVARRVLNIPIDYQLIND